MSAQRRCEAHFGASDRRCTRPAGHIETLHTLPNEISWPDTLVMRRTVEATLRSGELFAGVGGLGMAVNEVFGATPAWFSEFDAAPSKVLAHHYPDVPNFGDVTKVNWVTVPRVNILAGGFPCQDVSLAGRRAGMKDGTRSGLWSEYLKAIDALRPDWVVIENVRGLYSARADSEMEPCTWCLGDGADEYHLRALDAVLADLSAVGFDAEWTGLRAADVGAPHGRFRVFILAWPRERAIAHAHGRVDKSRGARADQRGLPGGDGSGARADGDSGRLTLLATPRASSANGHGDLTRRRATTNIESQVMLLPTPDAYAGNRGGSQHPDKKRAGNHMVTLQDVAEFTLLPTPVAQPSGNTPQEHLRKKPGRGVVTDLAIIAENGLIETGGRLLPTPSVSNSHGNEVNGRGEALLPGVVNPLPTPNVAMADGGQTSRSGSRKGELLLGGIAAEVGAKLLPTPNTMEHLPVREGEARERAFKRGDMNGSMRSQAGNLRERVVEELADVTDWGPYESAIRQWEAVIGRPAPAPVRFDGKGGKPRLNPELTEWMMGWPAGWVTVAVNGLTRAEQLKACGNGVVPQQAAAALRILLARPGVPSIEWEAAA